VTDGPVEVRAYRDESDRAGVIALWREAFAGDPPWNEPAGVIDRKRSVQPDLFLVAVATGDESVLGTVIAGYDGFRGWLHHVAVSPTARGRSIARALVEEAEHRLRAMGCIKVNLQVRDTNAGVAPVYAALGYEVEDRISMGKRL